MAIITVAPYTYRHRCQRGDCTILLLIHDPGYVCDTDRQTTDEARAAPVWTIEHGQHRRAMPYAEYRTWDIEGWIEECHRLDTLGGA